MVDSPFLHGDSNNISGCDASTPECCASVDSIWRNITRNTDIHFYCHGGTLETATKDFGQTERYVLCMIVVYGIIPL